MRTLYSHSEYEARVSAPGAREAIRAVTDSFEELDTQVATGEPCAGRDPLSWPGYADQLRQAAVSSDEQEAVVIAAGRLGRCDAIVVAMDFAFMGGSMGATTGARIVGAIEEARRRRWTLVSLIASGGARVQEGICSLIQMQRIAAACAGARSDGIPHIAVLRHPATGGVWAALGSTADVVFALDGATVAFAGPRVRGEDGRSPTEFTSAGQLQNGAVDQMVAENELRTRLALALELLGPDTRGALRRADVPRAIAPATARTGAERRSAWEQVLAARHADRPRAAEYLDDYFDVRLEIAGDRSGGRDPGILCGIGRREDRTIAYAAQTGTANTGAGFRTARRLLELAAGLRLPVLTLIDTPGAANDADAERGCVGTAIGELFQAVASSPVPITSLVIGEGGSGGALALASQDDLWIVTDGYFAVIAPESAEAILRDDRLTPAAIADRMRLTPADLRALGIVKGVVAAQ